MLLSKFKSISLIATTLVITGCAVPGNYHVGATNIGNDGVFAEELDKAKVDVADVNLIKSINKPIHIIALFGEWCHDSEREIPKLAKLLNAASNSNITIEYHGMSVNKSEPAALVELHQLRYTPTIVVLRNGKELGRIVEKPKVSLAADIAKYASKP